MPLLAPKIPAGQIRLTYGLIVLLLLCVPKP